MPRVSFVKSRLASSPLECAPGANLMSTLLEGGLPVASSCRGDGVCGKCRVIIVSSDPGALSPIDDLEKFLIERHSVPPGSRVSCQVSVLGDVTVDTTYW